MKASAPAKIHLGQSELLAEIQLTNTRTQTVKIEFSAARKLKNANRIEITSRCCIANNPEIVRDFLLRNTQYKNGGFMLCPSTKAIDFCQRFIIPSHVEINLQEIVVSALNIAATADNLERKISGTEDCF